MTHLAIDTCMTKFACILVAVIMSSVVSEAVAEETTETLPLDARHVITSESLTGAGEDAWLTPEVRAPFSFDELIYSWNVRLPEAEGFRLHLKANFAGGTSTGWQYAGYWGSVKDHVTSRSIPKFPEGVVDMDWLKLKQKAESYQFKVENGSTVPLTVLPSFHVVTTDNKPTTDVIVRFRTSTPDPVHTVTRRVLDLPFRRQMDSKGNLTPSRCQSAALASAMQYYGTSVPLEQVIAKIYDPEYEYPGLWPRVIGAAHDFGYDGYIDRFRDWDRVRQALAEHKVILCSIRMKKGDCKEPPYESMGNHIVALNGITDDGRVVVTDSALGKSQRGYRCQWLIEDFEKIWMKTKNGVAMVISPPENATVKEVLGLDAFTYGRLDIAGDDH